MLTRKIRLGTERSKGTACGPGRTEEGGFLETVEWIFLFVEVGRPLSSLCKGARCSATECPPGPGVEEARNRNFGRRDSITEARQGTRKACHAPGLGKGSEAHRDGLRPPVPLSHRTAGFSPSTTGLDDAHWIEGLRCSGRGSVRRAGPAAAGARRGRDEPGILRDPRDILFYILILNRGCSRCRGGGWWHGNWASQQPLRQEPFVSIHECVCVEINWRQQLGPWLDQAVAAGAAPAATAGAMHQASILSSPVPT